MCDVSRFVNVVRVLREEDSFFVREDPVVGLNVFLVVSMVTPREVEVRVSNEDVWTDEDDLSVPSRSVLGELLGMVESRIVFFPSVTVRDASGREAVAASSVGPISLLVLSVKISIEGSIMSDIDEVETDREACDIDDFFVLSFTSD
eukprot:sb/3473805/